MCPHGDKRSECHRCYVDVCTGCSAHPTACTCMVPPVDTDAYDAMRLFGIALPIVSNFRQTEWTVLGREFGPYPTRDALRAALRDAVIRRRAHEATGGKFLLASRLHALLEGTEDETECRDCGELHGRAAEGIAS